MTNIRDEYGVRDDSGGYYVTDEAGLLAEIRELLKEFIESATCERCQDWHATGHDRFEVL